MRCLCVCFWVAPVSPAPRAYMACVRHTATLQGFCDVHRITVHLPPWSLAHAHSCIGPCWPVFQHLQLHEALCLIALKHCSRCAGKRIHGGFKCAPSSVTLFEQACK